MPPMNPFPSRDQTEEERKAIYKSQHRVWLFTFYNIDEQGARLVSFLRNRWESEEIVDYFLGFEKCPTTGTQHCHVGVRFPTPKRYNEVRGLLSDNNLTGWKAPMKGTWEQAKAYAWKEKDEPYLSEEYFSPRFEEKFRSTREQQRAAGSGSRSKRGRPVLTEEQAKMVLSGRADECLRFLDAEEAAQLAPKMKELLSVSPARTYAPLVVWCYGPTRAGKSLFASWTANADHRRSVHFQGADDNVKFWNGYTQQEILVFDEAREANLPFQLFLRIANHLPLIVEVKNAYVHLNSPLIVVTSPLPPWKFWTGTVDQPGHAMDIGQAMRRICVVSQFFPKDPERKLVMSSYPPWKETTAPTLFLSQTDQDVGDLMERHKTKLTRILERSHTLEEIGQKLTPSNEYSVLKQTKISPWRISTPSAGIVALPVLERNFVLKGNQELSADEDAHWSKKIRLPVGMSDENTDEVVKDMHDDKNFMLQYVVDWVWLETATQASLFRHYYADVVFPGY